MSWVSPIYDRTNVDAQTKTSKGLFNISDWTRIYGNAQYLSNEFISNTGTVLTFTSISTPTMSSDPRSIFSMLTTLIANLETMRLKLVSWGASIVQVSVLSWVAGPDQVAPIFTDVNQWEYQEYLIKQFLDTQSISDVICGVAICGGDFVMDTI